MQTFYLMHIDDEGVFSEGKELALHLVGSERGCKTRLKCTDGMAPISQSSSNHTSAVQDFFTDQWHALAKYNTIVQCDIHQCIAFFLAPHVVHKQAAVGLSRGYIGTGAVRLHPRFKALPNY